MAERQVKRITASDCTILAGTAYDQPVVLLADEEHATTQPYSTVAKGTKLTLLHVNSITGARHRFPLTVHPQLTLFGNIINFQNKAGFGFHTSRVVKCV